MAKKYIDAELLVRKIKGQIRLENLNFAALGGGRQTFCINTLEWVLKQIDSLQQDFPTTDEQVKEFLATHPKIKMPEKYKNPDWLFKNQEQPKVELEEEIQRYLCEECSSDDEPTITEIATHFYELGFNARKEE